MQAGSDAQSAFAESSARAALRTFSVLFQNLFQTGKFLPFASVETSGLSRALLNASLPLAGKNATSTLLQSRPQPYP